MNARGQNRSGATTAHTGGHWPKPATECDYENGDGESEDEDSYSNISGDGRSVATRHDRFNYARVPLDRRDSNKDNDAEKRSPSTMLVRFGSC